MAEAAPFLMAAGAGVGALGAIQEAQAQAQSAEYNANVASQNAVLAQRETAENLRRQNIEFRKSVGELQVAAGTSGIGFEGNPADLYAESVRNSEMDILQIKYQGALKKKAYLDEERLQRQQSRYAKKAGLFKATSYLLSGGGQAAMGFAQTSGGKK